MTKLFYTEFFSLVILHMANIWCTFDMNENITQKFLTQNCYEQNTNYATCIMYICTYTRTCIMYVAIQCTCLLAGRTPSAQRHAAVADCTHHGNSSKSQSTNRTYYVHIQACTCQGVVHNT